MCAPLCSYVSPDPHTHTCHRLFFAGGPRQSGPVGRIRACISASMRAVIILQPHPMCHPVQPPWPAPGPAKLQLQMRPTFQQSGRGRLNLGIFSF